MDASSVTLARDVARDPTRELIVDLRADVRALERRVAALEQHAPLPIALAVPAAVPIPEVSAETVPALGRAVLGIAGAYLLRAMTEMSVLPHGVGVAAGIVYAAVWLALAGRPGTRSSAAAIHTSTSILILSPLLWEAAVSLHLITPWTAAAILAAFGLGALALSGKADLRIISTIAVPACAWVSIVLLFATRTMVPFTFALLVMAAATEAAEFFGRGPATRWLLVIAADLAALVLVGLTGQRLGLPEGYATVSTSVAAFLSGLLLAIYGASTLARTVIRGRAFSIFGILQTVLAFLIGLGGVWYVTHATPAVGGCSVAAGAGCYAVSSIVTGTRDRCIYSSFGLLLTAAGTWLLASGAVLILVWALIALALAFIDLAELGSLNAAAFLWLAATVPPHPFIVVIPAAAIVYAVVIRVRDQRWPALFIAAVMVWSIAGFAMGGIPLPSVPTAILTLCSLAMAACGTRWRRSELVWLMYGTMAAAGWLLVTRDLRSPTTMPIVGSLLLFGGALMLLPRILKRSPSVR